ncbi:hypothetical protein [Oceanithermus sp.]
MKRIWVLALLLVLSLAAAQNNANTAVPVTVLGYDLNVVWPAPALQLFGPDCDNTARAAFVMAHELDQRVPEEVERHACYRLLVSGADKQATTVNFISGYTRQGAGYTLTFERSSADGRLLQVWEKQGAPALVYVYTFAADRIDLVVGQVELAVANEG